MHCLLSRSNYDRVPRIEGIIVTAKDRHTAKEQFIFSHSVVPTELC